MRTGKMAAVTAQSSTAQGQAPRYTTTPATVGFGHILTIGSHLLDVRQRHGSVCPRRPVQQSGVCHHNCLRLLLLLLAHTVSPLCPLTPRLLKATPRHPVTPCHSELYILPRKASWRMLVPSSLLLASLCSAGFATTENGTRMGARVRSGAGRRSPGTGTGVEEGGDHPGAGVWRDHPPTGSRQRLPPVGHRGFGWVTGGDTSCALPSRDPPSLRVRGTD